MFTLNSRKDEKIQLYRKVLKRQSGSTKDLAYREFIYPESKYLSGGLYANARDMKNTEIVNNALQAEKTYLKFTVNRNPLIKEDLKVIYRGEIYDITPPIDNFDGRTVDITFMAVKSADTTKYTGDLFYGNN